MPKTEQTQRTDKSGQLSKVLNEIEETRKCRGIRLELSDHQLARVPKQIEELVDLQELDLSFNRLKTLPAFIGNLKQLRMLRLGGNQLSTLPASIGNLTGLQHLNLSRNRLSKLPSRIGNLANLRKINLDSNSLTTLPQSIGQMARLEELILSNNRLSSLPGSIGQMTNLNVIFAPDNLITELPEDIGNLPHLKQLYLSNNRLSQLPNSLRNASSLEVLLLDGNEALGIPTEVLGPQLPTPDPSGSRRASPREVLEYYFKLRAGRRPLNEAKLILVGRGGAGKTSIVNQLVRHTFRDEEKTKGIKITEWMVHVGRNESARLNVWDFGGQEIMHATHQFFLTERSLYLLVINGREGGEDEDAEYWLKHIESFGGDSPVIVALNKIKAHPFDLNRRALQEKYPQIRSFIKTDCKDDTGIRQLHRAIERETDRLEHLRDWFPSTWFSIKDELATMKQNYLSYDDYRQLCQRLGEGDSTSQESLAFYLHNLGIVLNYRNDPRLQEMHVLKPRWVTNGIYTILNSDQLEKQKGEIWLGDLRAILDARKYPIKMHRFLFDLMKKFDLCFSFSDDDTHYLIPELLDKQEPAITSEFDPLECLNFQYHYTVLPPGLLPRFIVRTHGLSEALPRWRTGVILKFEANRALVKADVHDKKIFVSVTGPVRGRRSLLAIVRADFDRIHRDIRNLQPTEMVPAPGLPDLVVPYKNLRIMEQRGIDTYTVVFNDDELELDIQGLLTGVDFRRTRKTTRAAWQQREAIRLFYIYSQKDEFLRNQLDAHLKLLQRRGLIQTWCDRQIEAGEDWRERTDQNLEGSRVILLLVSANFIASDYCYEQEMTRALEMHQSGKTTVIPVILRDVNWKDAPFARLAPLPKNARPVVKWKDRDSAWKDVSEGIQSAIEKMQRQ